MTATSTDPNRNSGCGTPHTHAMRSFKLAGLRGTRIAAPNELHGRKGLSEANDESAADRKLKPTARSARPASRKQPRAEFWARGRLVGHFSPSQPRTHRTFTPMSAVSRNDFNNLAASGHNAGQTTHVRGRTDISLRYVRMSGMSGGVLMAVGVPASKNVPRLFM
jgi:hypothetical protein